MTLTILSPNPEARTLQPDTDVASIVDIHPEPKTRNELGLWLVGMATDVYGTMRGLIAISRDKETGIRTSRDEDGISIGYTMKTHPAVPGESHIPVRWQRSSEVGQITMTVLLPGTKLPAATLVIPKISSQQDIDNLLAGGPLDSAREYNRMRAANYAQFAYTWSRSAAEPVPEISLEDKGRLPGYQQSLWQVLNTRYTSSVSPFTRHGEKPRPSSGISPIEAYVKVVRYHIGALATEAMKHDVPVAERLAA